MNIEMLLARLEGVKPTRNGYVARCPAHYPDDSPSLSVSEADGKILLHCFAGCEISLITEALRVEIKDLFTDPGNGQGPRTISRTFNYTDEAGSLLYQVVRDDFPNGKKRFRQRRPDGNGGWIWNLKNIRRVLYRLPNVNKETDSLIVFHEGEKAVEFAVAAGLPGIHTTTVGGSNSPQHTDFSSVKRRDVMICPDNDKPGEGYLRTVADLAIAAGASSVKALRLQNLPPKGDVVEWIKAGGTVAEFVALLEQAEPVEVPTIPAVPMATSRAIFRRVADIPAKPIHWLWEGRIARGKVSMLAGHPGLGKSQVTASMASIVSTGGSWPVDGTRREIGNVIILNAEDDPADTIRPRLEASEADLSRVYILDAVIDGTSADGGEIRRGFNLKSDISRLGAMVEEIGGAALVVIDPITAYLGMTDSHKNADVRALLSPLAEFAERYRAAVVCVTHLNKNSNGEALMRVTGSLAFVAAARAAFVVARDLDNNAQRLFLPLKNNVGNDQAGLAFTVEPVQVESPQGPIQTSRVIWDANVVTITAEEALQPPGTDKERSDLDDAKAFLLELLANGVMPMKEIQADAERAGHAWRTIQRAKTALKVKSSKEGMQGRWCWQLPAPVRHEERQETIKSATPRAWHSSGDVGDLRIGTGDSVEVEI